LILSVGKVLCTRYTHSLHPHCTHKVENAKGKGCTCTRCTRGSGIPAWALSSNHNAKQLILIRCKHSQRAARSFVRGLEIRFKSQGFSTLLASSFMLYSRIYKIYYFTMSILHNKHGFFALDSS
jgi:hypothetical protein